MEKVDDFYFLALADADELFPISDEKYADELQLQEVLISSSIAAVDRYGLPTKAIKKCQYQSSLIRADKMKIERGGPSNAAATIKTEAFCKICMEAYPSSQTVSNANCSHAFCRGCLTKYISTKIRENVSAIKCPEDGCVGKIEPESCQDVIPREVFVQWGKALCESTVLGARRFGYCPFKDCNALLLGDEGEAVTQSECPSCRRMFCASCNVAWHPGLSCEEVGRLGVDERGREDLKVAEIAKSNRWRRCPRCKYYVEKTDGCLHVTCRCRYEFCYGCGKKWNDTHACCSGAA